MNKEEFLYKGILKVAMRSYQPNLKDSKSIVATMLPLSSGNPVKEQ